MADSPYIPGQNVFENAGLILRRPSTLVRPGNYTRFTNWQSVLEGTIQPKFGTQKINSTALAELNLHTLMFLNDPVNKRKLAMAGAGNGLYRLDTAANLLSGFSGNPLSFVPYRASISSSPYMVIGDSNEMELVDSTGFVKTLGIAFPTLPDVSTVLDFQETVIDTFDTDDYVYTNISTHSCAATFVNGVDAILGNALQVVSSSGPAVVGKVLPATLNLNLVGDLEASDGDYINLWINIDNLNNLDYIVLAFDIDPATVSGGSFTSNAFSNGNGYSAQLSSATMQTALTATTGWYQWQVQRGTFLRYGTNPSLDWSTVVGFQIVMYFTELTTPVNATFDQMYIFGGQGPDSSVGVGYDWRYTDYDSSTGTDSNPSPLQPDAPPFGAGTDVVRSPVELVASYTSNPRVDQIRQWRRGGTLPDNWQLLGTQQNIPPAAIATVSRNGAGLVTVTTVAPHGFTDETATIATIRRDGHGNVTVTTTTPHPFNSGQTVFLAGVSDGSFDGTFTNLAVTGPLSFQVSQVGSAASSSGGTATVGASVAIAGVADSSFNGVFDSLIPTGPKTFTVQQSGAAATSTGGTVTIIFIDIYSDIDIAAAETLSLQNDQPVTTVNAAGVGLFAVSLPFIWGPYQGNVILGCGDPNRPGFLYWCNAGNPDGWGSINNVEVTQPEDPLQNGFYWNSQPWVFSKQNLFQIWPGMLGVPNQFIGLPTNCGEGLAWSPYAFVAGPDTTAIWFLGKAAIFETGGGPAFSITEEQLWPIFHGLAVETYQPIDFTKPNMLRMAYRDEEVLFLYQDTAGGVNLLAYHRHRRRWRHAAYWYNPQCVFAPPESGNALWFGGNNGFAFQENTSLVADDGKPVTCEVRTGASDGGHRLRSKEYGHFILDADPQAANLVVNILFNAETLNPFTFTFTGSGRQPLPQGLNDYYALDTTLDVSVTTSAAPVLYGWEFDYRLDRLAMVHAEVPEDSMGIDGWKHVYDGWITLRSTQPVTITLIGDGVTIPVTATQSLNTGGAKQKIYLQVPANKFKLLRRKIDCPVPFTFYPEDSALHIGSWADGGYRAAPLVENVA